MSESVRDGDSDGVSGQDLDGVLAVLTCQKSKLDLCELGEDIAKKDELLESFTTRRNESRAR